MPDQPQTFPESFGSDQSTGWPGGWYVYENGKVEGPFDATDAFALSAESPDGKPRLVSRKGFTQWYALKDLSEIFRMTEQMGRRASEQSAVTEAQIAGHLAAMAQRPAAASVASRAQPIGEASVPPRAQPAAVDEAAAEAPGASGPRVGKPLKGRRAASLAMPVSTPEAKALTRPSTSFVTAPSASLPPSAQTLVTTVAAEVVETADDTAVAAAAPRRAGKHAAAQKATAKQAILQEFFMQRGRLRLGKLRNPWISAFVGLPLSLGILWFSWFRDLSREVSWHARGTDKAPLPSFALALVPFVHMFMVYRLAKLMTEMEAQNRYRSVSPALAAGFALFPPFAMAYLQDAANRHWLLHVKHALIRK